jgi:putative transposase
MEKFQNKFRISSARAQWWDYGNNAAYFVTICTHNRVHFFGKIIDKQFVASEIGKLSEKFWHEIPNNFPFAQLGAFVVMPNHIHGIIIIDKPNITTVETRFIASDIPKNNIASDIPKNNIASDIPKNNIASDIPKNNITSENQENNIASDNQTNKGGFSGNKNPMLNENLSRIIRWYKGRCSFEMRKLISDFNWQARFHDHIIRNDIEYQFINDYIETNPTKWDNDKFFN